MTNIRNPISIVGKLKIASITTTTPATVLLSNTNSSPSAVYKVNSIFAANVDGANTAYVSISITDDQVPQNRVYIAKGVVVPATATQIISTKETYFYLPTNYSLYAESTTVNDIDVTVSYEVLT